MTDSPTTTPARHPRPALAALDALLARSAATNAAAALRQESDRRLAWRYEESEYLLLSEMEREPVRGA